MSELGQSHMLDTANRARSRAEARVAEQAEIIDALREDKARLDIFAENETLSLYSTTDGVWHVAWCASGLARTAKGPTPRDAIDAARGALEKK